MQQECARLGRDGTLPLALILCDIDFFKLYNDCYGHQAGDDCLRRVAQVLVDVAKRPGDLVARYGGEEFAVIIPQTDVAGARLVAENIHQGLASLKIPHQAMIIGEHVTLSIGIAIAQSFQQCLPERLVKKADDALYVVKKSGRNGSVCKELL